MMVMRTNGTIDIILKPSLPHILYSVVSNPPHKNASCRFFYDENNFASDQSYYANIKKDTNECENYSLFFNGLWKCVYEELGSVCVCGGGESAYSNSHFFFHFRSIFTGIMRYIYNVVYVLYGE